MSGFYAFVLIFDCICLGLLEIAADQDGCHFGRWSNNSGASSSSSLVSLDKKKKYSMNHLYPGCPKQHVWLVLSKGILKFWNFFKKVFEDTLNCPGGAKNVVLKCVRAYEQTEGLNDTHTHRFYIMCVRVCVSVCTLYFQLSSWNQSPEISFNNYTVRRPFHLQSASFHNYKLADEGCASLLPFPELAQSRKWKWSISFDYQTALING